MELQMKMELLLKLIIKLIIKSYILAANIIRYLLNENPINKIQFCKHS